MGAQTGRGMNEARTGSMGRGKSAVFFRKGLGSILHRSKPITAE